MEENVRLGRIAGIPVGINWSLLVIFWLITWGLADGRFPDQFPGHAAGSYWVAAVATALLFYGSLLAHELGHALVARRHGVAVDGITLWLFGGVARLTGEAASPRAEMRIAGVGPVVSLAVASAAGVTAVALDAVGAAELVVGSVAWLATINVILAVFNLAPAAPLDGGRILRAWLWQRHGDRVRASVASARSGRVFGYLLIGLGLVDFAVGAGIGGLWFVFLGWFLLDAARAEETHVLLRGALAGVRVRDVMTREPHPTPDWLTLDAFLEEHALRNRFSTFPAVDVDGRLTGLVTLTRIKAVPPERWRDTYVRDIARPLAELPTADPDEPMVELLGRLSGDPDGRALVVADGTLVGIISPTDVARAVEWTTLFGPHPTAASSVNGPRPSHGMRNAASRSDEGFAPFENHRWWNRR